MSKLHVLMFRHTPRDRTSDHITDVGKQKAHMLGEALHRCYPERNFIGMCSERLRTRETVEAILAGAGLSGVPIIQSAALQNGEFDPGWVQGEIPSPNAAFNVYLQFGD